MRLVFVIKKLVKTMLAKAAILSVLLSWVLGSTESMAMPVGNQAELSRPAILQAWQRRVELNQGVHAWNRKHDGMRVFQEWIALLTLAKSQSPEEQKRMGLKLQAYVVEDNIGPLGFIGTSLPVPGLDQGDFDMSLLGCSSLIQLFLEDRLLLTDQTLVHLIKNVIRTWGQTPKAYFDILFVSIPETENHLFMTESTRYLTNQILFENPRQLPALKILRDSLLNSGVVLDNDQGMLKRLLLQVMHQAMCRGFFEFNAQIYQRFTIHALDNLFSFAHDRAIRDGSGCLLDYLSTVFAFQSIGAIRYGPFRRSSEVYMDSALIENDAACSFFAIQSGAFKGPGNPRQNIWHTHTAHSSMALFSSVLKYRIPDPILNFMQVRPVEYRAEIRSAYSVKALANLPTELYSGGPGYLLTAGGRHQGFAGPNFPTYRFWFSDAPWVYDVITRSNSLLLNPEKDRPRTLMDILHFKGSQWRANNLALYHNFIYGYAGAETYNSEAWPHQIPVKWGREGLAANSAPTYFTSDFEFRFVDQSAHGIYLVLGRLRPPKTFFRWRYQKYLRGTIEVVDTSKVHSLAKLRDSVLQLNKIKEPGLLSRRRCVYVNITGDKIYLNPRYGSAGDGIVRVAVNKSNPNNASGEMVLPFDFPWKAKNPLLKVESQAPWKGTISVSDGRGSMYIYNPTTGDYGLQNFREWWNPQRLWVEQTDFSKSLSQVF